MDNAVPASFSVFRGQARTGAGEGPGQPIAHGEQYLRVDLPLYESGLLEAIRPWMTLDSDPGDHQRLNDQLEGWSFFSQGDYLFVSRLVSAGIYDRRAAYFSHGRAWRVDSLIPGFDPGLLLGRWDAFEQPWRDVYPGKQAAEPEASLVRPEQIRAEPETAARLLGHLFQARLGQYPLIVAAPLADFVSGGAIHALICLSRAGLPAHLRHACRIRVYSRLPELFLRHLQADLVVVPEDTANTALAARREATLLDRQGRTLAGKELENRALAYAEAVVERAIRIPQGLPFFSERFRHRFPRPELPGPEDVQALQITYNLAYALAGPEALRGDFLKDYLPKAARRLGPGLDWNRIIGHDEWRGFPREALLDLILNDAGDRSPAGHEFLSAVEDAASRLQLLVDGRLAEWWDPADPLKLRRLLELLAHEPPLVSETAAVERTEQIPIEQIAAVGPLAGVLDAELKAGKLKYRLPESAELARAAHEPRVFQILTSAVSDGRLDPAWARLFVRMAPPANVVEAARSWLREPRFWDGWENVPKLLLDRLRALDLPTVSGLSPLIIQAGLKLAPATNLEIYLRLADLVAAVDRADGRQEESALIARLWTDLPRLTDPGARAYLVGIALDDGWRCLQPASLVKDGAIRLSWAEEIADRLFSHREIADALSASGLLQLADHFRDEESLERLYEQLDRLMEADPETTTEALVRTGWWAFWRRSSRLQGQEIRQRSAWAWLTSDAWTDGADREATLEAWEQALADLPAQLSGPAMARLGGDGSSRRRRWPWIPPFEDVQLKALISRAEDLGALAELVEIVRSDAAAPPSRVPTHEAILELSDFRADLPAGALGWLTDSRSLQALSLSASEFLYRHAGHRVEQAKVARIRSVSDRLEHDPRQALAAADDPKLWNDGRFLSDIADWMARKGSLDRIGSDIAAWIDAKIEGTPVVSIQAPRALVRELIEEEFHQAAHLLDPEAAAEAQKESLAEKVVAALLDGRVKDKCWASLAAKVDQANKAAEGSPGRHPLTILADRIRLNRDLAPEQRRRLARSGWSTFEAAAKENTALMAPPAQASTKNPLLELAASLLGPGTLGTALQQVVFAPQNRGRGIGVDWWRGLLRTLFTFKRYGGTASADDWLEAAFSILLASLEELEGQEQKAFSRALEMEADENPQWNLFSELGVLRR